VVLDGDHKTVSNTATLLGHLRKPIVQGAVTAGDPSRPTTLPEGGWQTYLTKRVLHTGNSELDTAARFVIFRLEFLTQILRELGVIDHHAESETCH
jgi:hypothetical protein